MGLDGSGSAWSVARADDGTVMLHDGRQVQVPEGSNPAVVRYDYVRASCSEGFCPKCHGRVDADWHCLTCELTWYARETNYLSGALRYTGGTS